MSTKRKSIKDYVKSSRVVMPFNGVPELLDTVWDVRPDQPFIYSRSEVNRLARLYRRYDQVFRRWARLVRRADILARSCGTRSGLRQQMYVLSPTKGLAEHRNACRKCGEVATRRYLLDSYRDGVGLGWALGHASKAACDNSRYCPIHVRSDVCPASGVPGGTLAPWRGCSTLSVRATAVGMLADYQEALACVVPEISKAHVHRLRIREAICGFWVDKYRSMHFYHLYSPRERPESWYTVTIKDGVVRSTVGYSHSCQYAVLAKLAPVNADMYVRRIEPADVSGVVMTYYSNATDEEPYPDPRFDHASNYRGIGDAGRMVFNIYRILGT